MISILKSSYSNIYVGAYVYQYDRKLFVYRVSKINGDKLHIDMQYLYDDAKKGYIKRPRSTAQSFSLSTFTAISKPNPIIEDWTV